MATARDRVLAIRRAFVSKAQGHSIARGTQRLVFDQLPTLVRNKQNAVIGVEVMVRLFDGLTEIPIDPHRIIINPPLVPRANLTYVDDPSGEVDKDGLPVQMRIVGAQNPEAALLEALWDSIDLTPNAKGWRTRGTVTTVYATAPGGNGQVRSVNATYATARTGSGLGVFDQHGAGQTLTGGEYRIYESFVIFDTSGLPDGDEVSEVTLSLDGNQNSSTTDFDMIAATSTYDGGAVVTGDWVSGASLAALTTLASWNSSGYSANYNAFTSVAAFLTAINKTGNTSIILYSDRHSAGTVPTNAEFVEFTDADAAGTTIDPKLDITHAVAAAGVTWAMVI